MPSVTHPAVPPANIHHVLHCGEYEKNELENSEQNFLLVMIKVGNNINIIPSINTAPLPYMEGS
jgi:hypothetical protein